MSFPPLTSFMPHQKPMLLLDALVAHEGDRVVCEKTFLSSDLFVEGNEVSAFVALELFAQAAAAHFGYVGMLKGGVMGAGALLGTRRIDVLVPSFKVGDKLTITATQTLAMPPMAQFECTLDGAQGRYAEGSISVAIAPEGPG